MRSIVFRAVIGTLGLLGLLGSTSLPVVAAPVNSPDYAAIDSYVSNSLAGTPGFALSIVHGDQVTHVKGFGIANSAGVPMTADTPLVIGSQAKSFTALAIMQMSESGALSLDSPVQDYLPWFRVAQNDFSQQITIRQLLNQTSGLPPSAPFDTAVTTVESRVRDLASVNLTAPPGQLWQYSNSNYDVLGQVVATVSGQTYGDYMRDHVFRPLAMTHTFASEAEAQANGLGEGHQWWFGLPVSSDTYRQDYVPAGFLVSSANDMSHFLIAQLNGGTYNGQSVVSAQGVAAMHAGVVKVGTGGSYGMGWLADTLNRTPVVSHDGDSLNMHTDMILVPTHGWGVEIIANSDSLPILLGASVGTTVKGVISMLMGWSVPPTPAPIAIYTVFDLLVLALIAFQLWSLIRALQQQPNVKPGSSLLLRRIALPMGWRLVAAALPLGLLLILGSSLGAPISVIATTDIGLSGIAIAALLLVNGAVRAVVAGTAMRSRTQVVTGPELGGQ